VSTRGMREPEMAEIGTLVADVLESGARPEVLEGARAKVRDLCRRFPFYQGLSARLAGRP
jgi:glycine/serine hydroxymethyltransferase